MEKAKLSSDTVLVTWIQIEYILEALFIPCDAS